MSTKAQLMAAGMPALLATKLGIDSQVTVAAAGTTQANATSVGGNFTIISTAPSGTGVVLSFSAERGQMAALYNAGANTVKVYPSGTETINGVAGSTGFSVATTKAVILVASDKTWIALTG